MTYGQIRPTFIGTDFTKTRPAAAVRQNNVHTHTVVDAKRKKSVNSINSNRKKTAQMNTDASWNADGTQTARNARNVRGIRGAQNTEFARRPSGGRAVSGNANSREAYVRERLAYERQAEYERRIREMKLYEKRAKAELKRAKRAERTREKLEKREAECDLERREIKVRRAKLPFSFIAIMAAATIMIMAVVFSYSQVSETTGRLSDVQNRMSELEYEKEQLSHDLSLKNDVSVIEKRATEELMMVHESSIEKKYISLASDDRVVLENEDIGETEKSSALLSAFSAVFGNLMDYIG